jgi:hypothetical protein
MIIETTNNEYKNLVKKLNEIKFKPPFNLCFTLDAFPRSANSFANATFLPLLEESGILCDKGQIMHHTHSVDTLIFSIHMGIPTMSIVRNPVNAISSAYIFYQGKQLIDSIAKRWINFYQPLLNEEIKNSLYFIIVDFDEITQRTNNVIEKINDKFKFNLRNIECLDKNRERIFAEATERAKKIHGEENFKYRVGAPNKQRKEEFKGIEEKVEQSIYFNEFIEIYGLIAKWYF